jgi:hypothetical protein
MSAGDQFRLYSEWRRLTEAEALAIERAEWPTLAALHSAKQRLQTAILQAESPGGVEAPGDRAARRQLLGELIRLETRNRELLGRRRNSAEREQMQLEQSRSNLRRLQQRLVGERQGGWQCYS